MRFTLARMLALTMALAMLTLGACSNDTGESNPSSTASSSASSSSTTSSATSQSSSSQSEEPQEQPGISSSSSSLSQSETVLNITPIGAQGDGETFSITDSQTQDAILKHLANIQSVDPVSNPIMGGSFFRISVSENGITTEYELSNHDNTPDGNFRISKGSQSYSVDPALWDAIAEFYPSFAR